MCPANGFPGEGEKFKCKSCGGVFVDVARHPACPVCDSDNVESIRVDHVLSK